MHVYPAALNAAPTYACTTVVIHVCVHIGRVRACVRKQCRYNTLTASLVVKVLCLLASQVRPIAPHTLSHVRPLPPLTHLPPDSGDRDRVSVEFEANGAHMAHLYMSLHRSNDPCWLYNVYSSWVGFSIGSSPHHLIHRRPCSC